jgi:hypothetical protein
MSKTKLMEKIKLQLKELMSKEQKFVEVKAGDLMITSPDEELGIDSEVYTVDQDGNNIPLVDNDYKLDDGTTITVLGGKITSMVTGESTEEVPEVEIEQAKVDEEITVEEPIEEEPVEDEMKVLKDRVAKCEEMLARMSEEKESMKQQLSAISQEPSGNKIDVKPTEFKSIEDKKDSINNEDIKSLRETIRKKSRK